jgi:hypothetical protein
MDNFNSSSISMVKDDGNDPSEPLETLPNGPIQVKQSKMVKEVQAMARNYLGIPDSGLAYSAGNWPGCVRLLEQNP